MELGELHEIRFLAKATGPAPAWTAAVFLLGAIVSVALTALVGG